LRSLQYCPFIFQSLQDTIDECVSHVVGKGKPGSCTPPYHSHNSLPPLDHYLRSRGSSPSPRSRMPSYKVSLSQPAGTVTTASATAQRSLSAQNSQNDADKVDGAVVVPHKGMCSGGFFTPTGKPSSSYLCFAHFKDKSYPRNRPWRPRVVRC
jgi:hypothetical protein